MERQTQALNRRAAARNFQHHIFHALRSVALEYIVLPCLSRLSLTFSPTACSFLHLRVPLSLPFDTTRGRLEFVNESPLLRLLPVSPVRPLTGTR